MSGYANNSIFWVDTSKIAPNPFQPRREFNEHALHDLADSIRQYGVLQPLVVTRKESYRSDGGMEVSYELIAGERRLRASQIAGLQQVPVIIRSETDNKVKLELAIIENLQREDLNAIDRALAFDQLHREFNLTHAEIGKRMGKSRVYVSNSLRLLALPEEIKRSLMEGHITEGHTRPLLMLIDRPEEQITLFKEILAKNLSVRDAEKIARRVAQDKIRKKEFMIDPRIRDYELKISENLGTRVQIEQGEKGGKIVIDYFSQQDLDKLIHSLIHDGLENLKTTTVASEGYYNSESNESSSSVYTDSYSRENASQQYARDDLTRSTGLDFHSDNSLESFSAEKLPTTEEPLFIPKEVVSISEEPLFIPKEVVSISEEPLFIPEEIIPVSQNSQENVQEELVSPFNYSTQEDVTFGENIPRAETASSYLTGNPYQVPAVENNMELTKEFTFEPIVEQKTESITEQIVESIIEPIAEPVITETFQQAEQQIAQANDAIQQQYQAIEQNPYQASGTGNTQYYQQQPQNYQYTQPNSAYYANQTVAQPKKKGFFGRLFS